MVDKNKVKTLVTISLVLGGAVVVSLLFFYRRPEKLRDKNSNNIEQANITNTIQKSAEDSFIEKQVTEDFDGDGVDEIALAYIRPYLQEKESDFKGYIVVKEMSGEEIVRTPEFFTPVESPFSENMQVYRLDQDSNKEYLRQTIMAGSHHIKDLFLGIRDKYFLPVCKKDIPDGLEDCEFYTTRLDSLFMQDLDNDGATDIVELVDEYPPGGSRGRPVVAGIYNFNGDFFETVSGSHYDRLFNILTQEFNDLVSIIDLDEETLDNMEFMKKAWSGELLNEASEEGKGK